MMCIKNLIQTVLGMFNLKIQRLYIYNKHRIGKTNLNIGSGTYHIKYFTSLDLESEWYHRQDKKNSYRPYNIIKDKIPAGNSSVDNIYCSHVIEHLENAHVETLFRETLRVLKPGGVFRVSCPDAEFIWKVCQFDNEYWDWRIPWFEGANSNGSKKDMTQTRLLIREVATPRLSCYKYNNGDIEENIDFGKDMDKELSRLTNGLQFRENYPGDHINFWHFQKVNNLGCKIGFSYIVKSKFRGSISAAMRGIDFDNTVPKMSMYVDLVK